MKFELICNLIISIASLIPTIVSLVALIINVIKNKNWTLVVKVANSAMSTVEEYAKEHPGMTSEEKLEMAIKAIKSGCESAGIALDEATLARTIEYIQEMCAWAKTVNVTKTTAKKTASK